MTTKRKTNPEKRETKGKTPLDPTRPIGKNNPPIETQIQKGQILNPHGRPRKLHDLQELIKDTLAEEVRIPEGVLTRAQAMIRTMLIKSPTDRIALLEYAFGKVPTTTHAMDDDEWRNWLKED